MRLIFCIWCRNTFILHFFDAQWTNCSYTTSDTDVNRRRRRQSINTASVNSSTNLLNTGDLLSPFCPLHYSHHTRSEQNSHSTSFSIQRWKNPDVVITRWKMIEDANWIDVSSTAWKLRRRYTINVNSTRKQRWLIDVDSTLAKPRWYNVHSSTLKKRVTENQVDTPSRKYAFDLATFHRPKYSNV